MDILEVIALLSLCIACIKLGMEINKNAKITAQPRKLTVIFITKSFKDYRLSEAPFYIYNSTNTSFLQVQAGLPAKAAQITPSTKGAEIRKRIDIIIAAYITTYNLNPESYIRILIAINQGIQGAGHVISRFNLNRHKIVSSKHKEVFFQRRIILFINNTNHSRFFQRLCCNIFVQRPLIDT